MKILKKISLSNKIFISSLTVIFSLSLVIALFTRWILISSLTSELNRRGIGIAQSIAESSRSFMLTEYIPELTSLIFDARLGERKLLTIYIFILDKKSKVLSHTFTTVFPEELITANPLSPGEPHAIRLLRIGEDSAYDVAVPINEGIYQIGTVHVGLNKKHIDQLIDKLRITFLGFLSSITLLFFGISHWLSKYITRPIYELIKVSDEISRGNFDISLNLGSNIECWEIRKCEKEKCPAFGNTEIPCWYIDETLGKDTSRVRFPEKIHVCENCNVYQTGMKDEVTQLAVSFVNMTNRIKTSQVKLRESEEKYRSLFRSGPNPIFVLDRDTLEIIDANPSAEQTYNYSKDELTGRKFTDLGPEDTGLTQGKKDEEQLTLIVSPKVRHFKKGNIPFYVNIHATPTVYKEKDAFIVGITDVTEMIEKDTQLIQASKMTTLGEMSAGIAHELNQPLNAIKMGSEFLKMMMEEAKTIPEEDLYIVVDEVSTQVDRAADIINRLREFGRKADFTRERVNINKPIRGVLEIVGKQLKLQNIAVELNLDENLPNIQAHNNRLEQVVFNLVTNARDSILQKHETGPEQMERMIGIRSFMENNRVAVTVSDTGTGISQVIKERIFEAFFTTKQMGEGMGLGLSITNGIVKDYGGEIHVNSEEGVGTTFKLTFPC